MPNSSSSLTIFSPCPILKIQAVAAAEYTGKDGLPVYIPKIDPEIIRINNEIVANKTKIEKKRKFYVWLADKIVDIAALVISIIALFRTF